MQQSEKEHFCIFWGMMFLSNHDMLVNSEIHSVGLD